MLRRILPGLALGIALLGDASDKDGKRWWSHVQFLADDKLRVVERGRRAIEKLLHTLRLSSNAAASSLRELPAIINR